MAKCKCSLLKQPGIYSVTLVNVGKVEEEYDDHNSCFSQMETRFPVGETLPVNCHEKMVNVDVFIALHPLLRNSTYIHCQYKEHKLYNTYVSAVLQK